MDAFPGCTIAFISRRERAIFWIDAMVSTEDDSARRDRFEILGAASPSRLLSAVSSATTTSSHRESVVGASTTRSEPALLHAIAHRQPWTAFAPSIATAAIRSPSEV